MADTENKLAHLEAESLDTHVAVCFERYHHFNKSLVHLEGLIEKNAKETSTGFSEIKKMIWWSASTLFTTMLIALFAQLFKIL